MLTEKGKERATTLGTILVALENGLDEKDIADMLGVSRTDVVTYILSIAAIIDEYSNTDFE